MDSPAFCCPPDDFARLHFGACQLGRVTRTRRLVQIACALAQAPGKSLCELFSGSYAMNAAYDFFKGDYATPDALQEGHRANVRERMALPGRYLLLEDTSSISYTGRAPVEGLGPVGGKAQGFLLHSILAARIPDGGLVRAGNAHPTLELCGLLYQGAKLRPVREGKRERRDRREGEWLETDLWADAARSAGPAPQGVHWTVVADRGSDIADHLACVLDLGWHLVIRAQHNRRTTEGKLFDALRAKPPIAAGTLELRGRAGEKPRTAALRASALKGVLLKAPQAPGRGKESGPPLAINAVRVWEEGGKIEWLLLTDLPVDTPEQVMEVALAYACRWFVEEFHKALKTGMGAERLQLEHGDRLIAAVAVLSIVALRLLDMRDRLRQHGTRPAAESGLDQTELAMLRALAKRPLETVRDAILAVARLGGFPARKHDGDPGFLVLYRGMEKLRLMRIGYDLCAREQG